MTDSLPQQPPEDVPDFAMTSDAGNERIARLVGDVAAAIPAGEVERRGAVVALSDGIEEIIRDHPEANDVTVRDAILDELRPTFERAGWTVLEPFEF